MSKKASAEALAALHNELARVLTDAIENGVKVVTKDGDVEIVPAPAQILNVARQFLKDNGIESTGEGESPLGNLADSLPFQEDSGNTTIQ